MKFLSLIMGTAALCSVASLAEAQSDWFKIPPDQAVSSLDVGIAAVSRETYVGSQHSNLIVLPYVNATHKGRYFINPALGAGVYAINNGKVRLGASANLALGRKGRDTPFAGTPYEDEFKVKTGVTGSVFGRVYLPFAAFDVVGTIPVSGGLSGAKLDTLLTTQFSPLKNLTLTPGVRATFNTGAWLDTNYGISAQQAAASGLAPLSHDAELSTVGAHVAGYYKIGEDYQIVGVINQSWLVGDVKDSPLTPENTGLTVAMGVARKF
jgi:outer membrane scaffolding protein for murein synthesis (MipA/OmpV family)